MPQASFRPGRPWLDTTGAPINAHGGAGVLHHRGGYYWYGEARPEGPSHQGARSAPRPFVRWEDEWSL